MIRTGSGILQLMSNSLMPAVVSLIVLALPTATLAQTTAAWEAIVAAAKKEGRLMVYSGAGPAVTDRLKPDFENAVPGITVEVHREASGPMIAKIDAERKFNADGADLVITTELNWLEERDKDGSLKAPAGPAVASWPAAFMRGGKTIPIIALEPIVIVYNTNLVKTPLTGYQDFLKPEFKGRFATTTLAATTVIAWYDWLDKTLGADFTAKIAAQQPRMYVGTIPSTQSTVAGEVLANIYSNPGVAMPLIEQGAPIKIVYPKPTFGIRYVGGILGWSKRPNAAQVFMNYLLTVRGQVAWAGPGGTASPLPNIPRTVDARSINPFEPVQYSPEVIKALTEKWNKLYKAN